MHPDDPVIRDFLSAALRKEKSQWPAAWAGPEAADAVARAAIFHGVAALLLEQARPGRDWPDRLMDQLREESRARAMWELRHRQLLTDLLAEFAEQGIRCLVLKGTAIAYDLYPNPSTRSRGDTDLLVDAPDEDKAKALLARLGYAGGFLGGVTAEFSLQQVWTLSLPDGGSHAIDLHWQVMNAPSLKALLRFADCYSQSRLLPALSPHARTMSRVHLMIHTCLHRAMQCNAPYFVDGRTYFEPGRLIWSWDLHLLAQAFADKEWSELCTLANGMGVTRPCLKALLATRSAFGTDIPADARATLEGAAKRERGSPYFARSHALARAWRDIRSVPGLPRKLRYVLSRILTTEDFLRRKYPGMAARPMPMLYGRRLLDLMRGASLRTRQ